MGNNNNYGGMWMQAAAGAAQGGLALGLQRVGVNYDNRKQMEQQRKLSELQIDNETKLMDIQNQKQYEMWLKTNYGAQVDQLNKAGLNPALMYGMGGGGGATVGGGMPNVSTATASNPETSKGAAGIMGMGLQGAMIEAQIENIKANTNKTNVDAGKAAGVDTDLAKTQIASLTQGISNQKAVEALTNILIATVAILLSRLYPSSAV